METRVRTGLDRAVSDEGLIPTSDSIALLTNRATITSDGRWALDALHEAGYRIALLLTPEHGLDVAAGAGAPVGHGRLGDLPVLSLYGADSAPVEEALAGVDRIVADLPDVGARYYTYPWTVRETMRLAAGRGIPMTILDRPNPIGGIAIEGNLPEIDSPVCSAPVPNRHGLTLGELSHLNRRAHDIPVDLDVVTASGWQREMLFPGTGLPWIPPSPALSTFESVMLYPGTCLLEGTSISEGRGTDAPFRQFGSPRLDSASLIGRLTEMEELAGVELEEVRFTPSASKWEGEECTGIRLRVTDADRFRPVSAGLAIVAALRDTPDFRFLPFFDKLAGTGAWRESLEGGAGAAEIEAGFAADAERFRAEREDVLLYR